MENVLVEKMPKKTVKKMKTLSKKVSIAVCVMFFVILSGCVTNNPKMILPHSLVTAVIYYDLGNNNLKKGEYKKAIKNYTKAINIWRYSANYYQKRAMAYIEIDDYSNALKDYNTAIELDSENGELYYNRGLIYILIDEAVKARSDFKDACSYGFGRACRKKDQRIILKK